MKQHKFHLEHWQIIALLLAVYDAIVVNVAFFLGLWFRFDCIYSEIPPEYFRAFLQFVPIYTGISLITFWFMKL